MSIDVVISTSTSQITDTNGVSGFGTITVYPAQPFSYYDGSSTINVTANATTISVQDGKFSSPTTLTLAPSKDASNNPETYYIVDIRVNGTFQRILWSIPNTPLTYEFSAVPQIANGTTVDASVTALLNATDPFKQYVLRSDTLTTPVAGTASDGRGYIPRGDTTNGNKLDPSWLGGSGSGGELTAADIPIVDAGGYYTGTDVEAALQEAGADITTNATDITTLEASVMILLAAANMGGTNGLTSEGTFDAITGAYASTVVDTTYWGSIASATAQTANLQAYKLNATNGTYEFILPTGYTKSSVMLHLATPTPTAAGNTFLGIDWVSTTKFQVKSYDNTGTLANATAVSVVIYKIGL